MIAPWITTADLEDQVTALANPALAQEAIESATWILWMLSARKYGGVRQTTEVYCQMGLSEIATEYPRGATGRGWQVWPEVREGSITNMIGGCCGSCGCTHLLRLRGGPIISIEAMTIGGRDMTADEIAIYDYSYVSTSRGSCWSGCDDVEVTYTYGTAPPAAGRIAAKVMADQYILSMTDVDNCDLPQRVTQVSRQGMSWTLLDPQEFLDKGRTGIYQADLFLRVANPSGALLRARVFSPDVPRGKSRRVQTPALLMSPMLMSSNSPTGGASTMTMSVADSLPTTVVAAPSGQVTAFYNRPLRWVVPGAFDADHPPVITVQPSGEEVPSDALLWRSGNYTLDLTSDQVEQLLPPGSALAVSSATGTTSYPVERRNL
jgi:hypothetical protein